MDAILAISSAIASLLVARLFTDAITLACGQIACCYHYVQVHPVSDPLIELTLCF